MLALASLLLAACVSLFCAWVVVDDASRPAQIFAQPSVFSAAECQWTLDVVAAAEQWEQQEEAQTYLPTEEVNVLQVPALENLTTAVDQRVLPLLRRLYAVPEAAVFHVVDLYIVRYRPELMAGLRLHVDAYDLSFSVALNDPQEYGAGGLHFDLAPGQPFRSEVGAAVLFPAKALHAGLPVSHGARYALVGLVHIEASGSLAASLASLIPSMRQHTDALDGFFASCAAIRHLPPPTSPSSPAPPAALRCIPPSDVIRRHLWSKITTMWHSGSASDLHEVVILNVILLAVPALMFEAFFR